MPSFEKFSNPSSDETERLMKKYDGPGENSKPINDEEFMPEDGGYEAIDKFPGKNIQAPENGDKKAELGPNEVRFLNALTVLFEDDVLRHVSEMSNKDFKNRADQTLGTIINSKKIEPEFKRTIKENFVDVIGIKIDNFLGRGIDLEKSKSLKQILKDTMLGIDLSN